MPSSERLIGHLESLYKRYGYEILFIGALIESLVVVNLLAPGMVVLAFGGVFAKSGQLDLTATILAAVSGAMTGYIVDFLLGAFGFSKIVERIAGIETFSKVKKRVNKTDIKIFSLGFFHPNLGSIISLAAGAVEMRFISFISLSFISTLIWFIIWSLLVYMLGDFVLDFLSKYLTVLGLIFTTTWFLVFMYGRRRKSKVKSKNAKVM